MPKRNNPFRPTSPVFPGIFAGRAEEVQRIQMILQEARDGNPTNLLILGERGIGKTSLLLLARAMSCGVIDGGLDFLSVSVSINGKTSQLELVEKINAELARQIGKTEAAKSFLKDTWGFIQRLEIAGTRLRPKEELAAGVIAVDELAYAIADTVKTMTSESTVNVLGLKDPKDGLVIFIDEVDSANNELDLGSFLKQLSEKLVNESCTNVLFVLAGLPQSYQVLVDSHPSALRIFEELELLPLPANEIRDLITLGLDSANRKNESPVTITDEALRLIAMFSEGYPHFAQQFGYSAYSKDIDNLIDEDDMDFPSALRRIGDSHYKDMYFNMIGVDSYRRVLQIMAGKSGWITKQEIRGDFEGSETTLANALKALSDRNIIQRKPGTRGVYKLQWVSFAIWISAFTDKNLKL